MRSIPETLIRISFSQRRFVRQKSAWSRSSRLEPQDQSAQGSGASFIPQYRLLDLIPEHLELAHRRARELLCESADRIHVDLDENRTAHRDSFAQHVADGAKITDAIMREPEGS